MGQDDRVVQLLRQINLIQSIYQDICDVLDDAALPADDRLRKIRFLTARIGQVCADVLPG